MADPVNSHLDTRFSDPDTEATDWDETLQALEQAELFWVTTVRSDGRPHTTPLVAVWTDGALHFSTGVGEQKEVNLRNNRRIILMTGRNDWDQGLDIMVEGEAERVEDRDRLERAAMKLTAKWDGRWNYVVTNTGFEHPHDQVLVFAVRPERVLVFGKGTSPTPVTASVRKSACHSRRRPTGSASPASRRAYPLSHVRKGAHGRVSAARRPTGPAATGARS